MKIPGRSWSTGFWSNQKIKAASALLREKEGLEIQKWQRILSPPLPREESEETVLQEVSLFDLAEMFFSLMQKRERESARVITGKDFSLEEKMKEIILALEKEGYLDFVEYFHLQDSLTEALGSFFCLLELIRRKTVVALQESLFEPIKVWLRKEARA